MTNNVISLTITLLMSLQSDMVITMMLTVSVYDTVNVNYFIITGHGYH